MNHHPTTIRTGSAVDLAFAVVVMASYFAIFSSLRNASFLQINLLIGAGIAYIGIGIYGFALCSRSKAILIKIVYFTIQIALGGVIVYLGKGMGYNALLLLPLAGQSVILLSSFWVYLVNAGLVGAYVAAIGFLPGGWEMVGSGLPTFLAGIIFIIFFTEMAVGEEKARTEVEQLVTDLAAANQQLREYAVQVEELAITKERNRMAREIHDGLGHYLTTINMQIQAGRAVLAKDPTRAAKAFERAQNLTQEALLDVRDSVSTLRMQPDESLPLVESIQKMLQDCEIIGLIHDLRVMGEPRKLSAQTQLTLFRAVQEGLSNIKKHAKATQIWLILDYSSPSKVRLAIRDDGIGAERVDGGYGLLGLRERVQLLNGNFQVESVDGHGFLLEITLPA